MATVSGSGSRWNNSGWLCVGGSESTAYGTGTLNDIADGGVVDVTGTTKIWNTGTLNLNGGSLTTGTFDNTAGGAFFFNDGTLTVNGSNGTFSAAKQFLYAGIISTANPTLVLTGGAYGTGTQ